MNQRIMQLVVGLAVPLAALAQTEPAPNGAAAVPTAAPPKAAVSADTGRFPLRYHTALPRTDSVAHYAADYAAYRRFLTPEIRRTQMELRSVANGVNYRRTLSAATAAAQLDTLTRLTDPAQAQGHWRSVLSRVVEYRDSAVVAEKRIYRQVRLLRTEPEPAELTLADGRLVLVGRSKPGGPAHRLLGKNYDIVSGRYLLLYGLARSGGYVSQIGLDAQGRLLLYSLDTYERTIPGKYLTYKTVLIQTIFERRQP